LAVIDGEVVVYEHPVSAELCTKSEWRRDAIGLRYTKDRRAAQLPERPSSACSSSTLRGDLRTSAPGAYLPAVSASGTCAYGVPLELLADPT
jgi:hypothetical protein